MSYILDALKKSEEQRVLSLESERDKESTENSLSSRKILDSHESAEVEDVFLIKENWPLLVVFTIFLTVLLFLVWTYQSKETRESQNKIDQISELIQENESEELRGKTLKVDQGAQEASSSKVVLPKDDFRTNVSSDSDSKTPVRPSPVAIEKLSDEDLSGMESMDVSSHIFSTVPQKRSVVVNDVRYKEGEFINARAEIFEITPTGFVLSIGGKLAIVSRSRGWAP